MKKDMWADKDIEFIVLHKEYIELNSEEKQSIAEYAKDESEFNDLKLMLLGIEQYVDQAEVITPRAETKDLLMAEFEQQAKIRPIWYNSVSAFLLPKDKSFFQKPAAQMAALAACIVLVVTIMLPGKPNSNLAQHEPSTSPKVDQKSTEDVVKPEVKVSSDTTTENWYNEGEAVKSLEEIELADQEIPRERENDVKVPTFEEEEMIAMDIMEDEVETESRNASAGDFVVEADFGADADDQLVLSGATEPTFTSTDMGTATVEEVEVAMSKDFADEVAVDKLDAIAVASKGKNAKKERMDLPVNSRSLQKDADLIAILYTAM